MDAKFDGQNLLTRLWYLLSDACVQISNPQATLLSISHLKLTFYV